MLLPILFFPITILNLHWTAQQSNTTASLRGLQVVSPQIVWASGTQGTFLRTTDGGEHWQSVTVAGAGALDFRDVEAFDAQTAFLLASGEGDKSRVYKTTDGGAHWQLLFTNPDARGFFDDLAFWDTAHGILLGDPVDGRFTIFTTTDGGQSWQRQKTPASLEDEGAFAASGTSLATSGTKMAWFGTGGPHGARVFQTHDRGRSWSIATTPLGGGKTAGIFSLARPDQKRGVAVGGDYQKANRVEQTVAVTNNGGKTWKAAADLAYRSGVASVGNNRFIAVGTTGSDLSQDGGHSWHHFSDTNLNAVAASAGSVWAVGPKGVIVKLVTEH